jgi:hypothetical protein
MAASFPLFTATFATEKLRKPITHNFVELIINLFSL